MRYGIREICDVVFKAKGVQKVGNRIFYKDEPIMYFDTLKTSSLEAASASVYAQGGRGNPRLIAWDGDRTLTFNMEDALISSEGLQILSGAGLMEASTKNTIKVHSTSQLAGNDVKVTTANGKVTGVTIYLPVKPYWPTFTDSTDNTEKYVATGDYIYVFPLDEYGEVYTEPFIPDVGGKAVKAGTSIAISDPIVPVKWDDENGYVLATGSDKIDAYQLKLKATDDLDATSYATNSAPVFGDDIPSGKLFKAVQGENVVLIDYYVEKASGAQQIEITADKFGGTYYIEGDTLFRTQQGLDMPAEFIIPNGKIQSNFTFSMAATGDPSTFTFTVDAMPDYTRFDKTKKVLAAIQIVQDGAVSEAARERTYTAFPDGDPSSL